jgi:hypothetical protein
VAEPGTDAGNLVCGDGCPNAAAADEHASLGAAVEKNFTHRFGIVGIIHRIVAVGSDVDNLMAAMAQIGDQYLFEVEARMIGAYGDASILSRIEV